MDVKDAYGSLNHAFIKFVMEQYKVPREIYEYTMNFYTSLRVRILYGCETSDYFRMERGVLQGDHLSNIIFVMCMGYIINILADKFKHKKPSDIKNMFSCFVDDILHYSTDSNVTKMIVEEFVRLNIMLKTGLEINFEKSFILLVGDAYRSHLRNGLKINNTNAIRLLGSDEIVKYLGSYIDASSEYDVVFMDHINKELIADFRYAEREMIKKNVLDAVANNSNNYNILQLDQLQCQPQNPHQAILSTSALGPQRQRKKKQITKIDQKYNIKKIIVQKIYSYLISKIEWRLVRMIMPIEKMNDLLLRLDNIIKYYSKRWNVIYKSPRGYKYSFLNMKNTVHTILNESDPKFKRAIDDTVLDMYKKTRYTCINDSYKSSYELFMS